MQGLGITRSCRYFSSLDLANRSGDVLPMIAARWTNDLIAGNLLLDKKMLHYKALNNTERTTENA